MDRCSQCGFGYDDFAFSDAPVTLRRLSIEYAQALDEPRAPRALRSRPSEDVWSALEYACHVRDVHFIQRDRTLLALVEDRPHFPSMHREERVVLARYGEEDPDEVARELLVAANMLARLFEGLTPAQAARRCIYNFPEPTERDVAWLARHTVHESSHHLGDIRSVLERVGS